MNTKSQAKVWRSYGGQITILTYLADLEVLQLQSLDQDSYNRTIARCEYTFRIQIKMIAFTFPSSRNLSNCIMLLENIAGEEVTRKFMDHRLNFTDTQTVVVNKEMYAFARKYEGSVLVYKLSNFTSAEHLVKTTLPAVPCGVSLANFSVCYVQFAGSIILTGGTKPYVQ